MQEFTFAGFAFPRHIPEFYRSPYNRRTLASGRDMPARMRFAYSHAPKPMARGTSFYLASDFAPGLRWQWCDDVDGVRIYHTGWFTDPDGDGDKIRGVVFRLPRGRGFLAGWSMGKSMASSVDYHIYADEVEAARAADNEAEAAAERQWEHELDCVDDEVTRCIGDDEEADHGHQ